MDSEFSSQIVYWEVSIILWVIGALAWFVTYIGAPMESKKSGRYVSGIPGTAFILFLIAGLASPVKLLALLCFLDFSITCLPFYIIKEEINRKSKEKNDDETKE